MRINNFKELEIWRLSIDLAIDIYKTCSPKNFCNDYSLVDQIRGAIVSVSSNIVEGFEKNNNKEFIRYLTIAKGSLGEVRNQLEIAYRLNYISESKFKDLDEKSLALSYKIGGFIRYLKLNIENKK